MSSSLDKNTLVELLLDAVDQTIEFASQPQEPADDDLFAPSSAVKEVLETGTITVIKSIIEHGDTKQKQRATDILKNVVLQREGSDKIKAAMLLLSSNKKTKALDAEVISIPKRRIK